MAEEYYRATRLLPTNGEELIEYLEAVIRLTESEDTTAGFLLRLVVSTLRSEARPLNRPTS